MLSIFPRGVLDEILNLIESVSEDFPSYSTILFKFRISKEGHFGSQANDPIHISSPLCGLVKTGYSPRPVI